ncbi:MAG: DNA polymerase III subunit delta [Verrucomicrobiota bacterium]
MARRTPTSDGPATPSNAGLTAESTPLMLVAGDDDLAIQQRARATWDAWCRAAGGMDHEIIEASAGTVSEVLATVRRAKEALQTLPFFGGPKLVWLKDCTFLADDRSDRAASSEAVTAALSEWAAELKAFSWQGVRFLVSAFKPDKRRAFFKLFEQRGVVEIHVGLSADDKEWAAKVTSEATRLLVAAGRSVDYDVAEDLAQRVGPNLRSLANEVEKLVAYSHGRDLVTTRDVEAVVARQKQAQAFGLGEMLGERNLARALRMLDEELWEIRARIDKRKSEVGLLYGLISKVRALIIARELLHAGLIKPAASYPAFADQLRRLPPDLLPADRQYNPLASPYPFYRATLQCRNYESHELVRAMELLLDANRRLVGSEADEARILQELLVQIIGRPPAKPARQTA